MNVLTITNARKAFGPVIALDGASLDLRKGELLALLGPNGAGKTTLIRAITGRVRLDAGEIRLFDRQLDGRETPPELGIVPQEIALYPNLTARENLDAFGRLNGLSGADLTRQIDWALNTAGLADRASESVKRFSGGMRRRLNIACGVLHHPKIVLLDEPTVGVDPQSRNAILDSVEALASEGMAVLYTTHYMEEAERLCDRVGILDEGSLKAEGTRRELISLVGEHDRLRIDARGDLPAASAAALAVPGVEEAVPREGGLDLMARDVRASLAEIVRAIDDTGAGITSIEVEEPNLEAVFLHLTGKALRDEA
jgi:ABC-2 type transport system ATP-binding protein